MKDLHENFKPKVTFDVNMMFTGQVLDNLNSQVFN